MYLTPSNINWDSNSLLYILILPPGVSLFSDIWPTKSLYQIKCVKNTEGSRWCSVIHLKNLFSWSINIFRTCTERLLIRVTLMFSICFFIDTMWYNSKNSSLTQIIFCITLIERTIKLRMTCAKAQRGLHWKWLAVTGEDLHSIYIFDVDMI